MRRWMVGLVLSFVAWMTMSGSPAAQNAEPPPNLRPYFLVLLRQAEAGAAPVQPGDRQAYVAGRLSEGGYKIAASVTDGGSLREALIVAAPDMASARTLVENDPLVKTAGLRPEIHPMLAPDLSALDDTVSVGSAMHDPAGLKTYYLVMLVNPGPERIPMSDGIFAAHMAYRNARSAAGEILTGGPVTDGGRIRGVSLVRAADREAADLAAREDPAVQAGILAPETHTLLARDLSPLASPRGARPLDGRAGAAPGAPCGG